jgi:hypothetical protein
MFRAWARKGVTPLLAGNLVAIELGVPTAATGWTQAELAHLLFLVELVRTGRVSP